MDRCNELHTLPLLKPVEIWPLFLAALMTAVLTLMTAAPSIRLSAIGIAKED